MGNATPRFDSFSSHWPCLKTKNSAIDSNDNSQRSWVNKRSKLISGGNWNYSRFPETTFLSSEKRRSMFWDLHSILRIALGANPIRTNAARSRGSRGLPRMKTLQSRKRLFLTRKQTNAKTESREAVPASLSKVTTRRRVRRETQ